MIHNPEKLSKNNLHWGTFPEIMRIYLIEGEKFK